MCKCPSTLLYSGNALLLYYVMTYTVLYLIKSVAYTTNVLITAFSLLVRASMTTGHYKGNMSLPFFPSELQFLVA